MEDMKKFLMTVAAIVIGVVIYELVTSAIKPQ